MSSNPTIETTFDYVKIIERYAPFFERPEARIRFLQQTVSVVMQDNAKGWAGRYPFVEGTRLHLWLLKWRFYGRLFEEIREHLPANSSERRRFLRRIEPQGQMFFRLYLMRHVLYGASIVLVLCALFGLYRVARGSSNLGRRAAAVLPRIERPSDQPEGRGSWQGEAPTGTVTNHLPDYQPEKVWLVERKDDYELYSNGARIMLGYETDTHTRAFRALARGTLAIKEGVRSEPAGILYHTSENDLLPFTPDNSSSIEAVSKQLLEFVHRHNSYNYLIDRFGQIHRIVRDGQVANHAGNSIWGNEREVYVGLNESFIGVCFETRTGADALDEQLTEAQLIAGRLLTAILRSRYNIEDANCATHGMVSVNASNMLIGYHYDWARNFPFQAMGLSDKYVVPPASISEFGFTYDNSLVQKLGGTLWPGVRAAEQLFEHRAQEAGLTTEEMRARTRKAYLAYTEMARGLRAEPPGPEASARSPE